MLSLNVEISTNFHGAHNVSNWCQISKNIKMSLAVSVYLLGNWNEPLLLMGFIAAANWSWKSGMFEVPVSLKIELIR